MKTLVIGLDGADFDVMGPWIRKGRLPNIEHLITNGVSCPLRSTWPPTTSPAWPAMVTGMSPGNLGLFDFVRPDGYGKRLVSRLEIPYPALWDILTRENKKVVIVGVPMTYPPPKVNGAMVAGFLSPTGRNNGQPLDLLERFPRLRVIPRCVQRPDDLVRRAQDVCNGTLALLKAYEPELAMVVFNATDWAMHYNWSKPRAVRRVFESVDAEVGRLVDQARADNVVVVSDHGFGSVTHFVNVNRILLDMGFLADGKDLSRMYPVPSDFGDEEQMGSSPTLQRLSWLGLLPLKLGRRILKALSGSVTDIGRFTRFFADRSMQGKGYPLAALGRFNWDRTKAYMYSHCSMTININVKGREPKGIVSKDDFERVRSDVIAALKEWKDPDTGKRIFRWVRRPEEIYTGKRVNLAPDIFFELEPGMLAVGVRFGRPIWKVRGAGHHAPCGVFIGHGEMFKKADIDEMNIIDVLPTLLEGMSVPAPEGLDGRVVEEIMR